VSAAVRPAPEQQQFSPGIALAGWAAAFACMLVGDFVILAATGHAGDTTDQLPLWLIAVLEIPLWIGLVGATVVISRRWGTNDLKRDYGLSARWTDAAIGLPLGALCQLVLVPIVYMPLRPFIDTSKVSDVARSLTDRATGLGVVLLFLVVVVGAPIVEELFYRGLLMRSLQARWNDGLALVATAILFGAAHFEPLQFPALAVFGLVLGYCAQRTGRLGMSMFTHAGFNLVTVIVLVTR
jgi:membrane protease YdiL (CAAX protease family)